MKLLILAQTPPPLHGQSLMVETAVRGLPEHGIEVCHVNLRLSRNHDDIGGWRPGKILAILDACFHAIVARFTENCDTLYYVPAPAKRGALYRDWLVMALCRPFFRRLVLHFHNGGLGDWLARDVTTLERAITRGLLGRADLAIVLAPSLRADAAALNPRRIAVVANGIDAPVMTVPPPAATPFTVLFLGLCSEDKGVFDAIEAVRAANDTAREKAFALVVAGAFPDAATAARFEERAAAAAGAVRHAGFVRGAELEALWSSAHCLCLPTRYAHEGQPLVVLEALARDRPVVATHWRALADLPASDAVRLAPPGDAAALRDAVLELVQAPPSSGSARRLYLEHFTVQHHLEHLATELTLLKSVREESRVDSE